MTGRFVAVVGGATDGKPSLLVAASRDLAPRDSTPARSCARRRRSSAAAGRPRRPGAGRRQGPRRLDEACARRSAGARGAPAHRDGLTARAVVTAVGQPLEPRRGPRAERRPRRVAPAIAALDIGTEFAKALVLSVERDAEGRLRRRRARQRAAAAGARAHAVGHGERHRCGRRQLPRRDGRGACGWPGAGRSRRSSGSPASS